MDSPRWKWNGNEIAPEVDWNSKEGGGSGTGGGGNLVIDETNYFYSVKVVNSSYEPIRRASVTFQLSSGESEMVLTDASGRATHTESNDLNPPENCICTVNVVGYDTINETVPRKDNQVEYTEIIINQTSDVYYYALSVVDRTSREPVPDATVEIYNINQTVLLKTDKTNSEGSYIYTNTDGNRLYFQIKKNGYKDSGKEYIVGSQTPNDVKLFRLERDAQANYYYVIAVKDNAGKGVSGAKVRVYKDFSYNQPYSSSQVNISTSQAEEEIFYEVCQKIAAVTGLEAGYIQKTDKFIADLGITKSEMTSIMSGLDSTFKMETTETEFMELEDVNQLIDYIQSNSKLTKLPVTILTTDANGLINVSNQVLPHNQIQFM